MKRASLLLLPVFVMVLGTAGAAREKPLEQFSALAVNLDAPTGFATFPLQIQISRWSTDAERDRLTTALNEKGQDKMLDVLSKLPRVGSIRTLHSVGYDLRYARRVTGGTNDRMIIVTDRPIGFWERRYGGRSIDYPFTVIELRVGPSGVGEGEMSVATKVIVDEASHFTALENYTIGPVLLKQVRREG